MLRTLLATAVLLASALPAVAGSVPWSYKVVDYNPPARVLAAGTGQTAAEWVLTTLARPKLTEPTLPDLATFIWNDYDQTVSTRANVLLTDERSGMTAWRPVDWGVTRTWVPNADRTAWVFAGEVEGTYRTATNPYEPYLGGNTYNLWVDADRNVRVRVLENTPPTHQEPEPATLVLAGIGAGAVGLLRRRRARTV